MALVLHPAVTAAPSVRAHPWGRVRGFPPFLVSLALPDSDLAVELQAHLGLDLFPGGAIFHGRPEVDGSYLTFPGYCPGPGLRHCPGEVGVRGHWPCLPLSSQPGLRRALSNSTFCSGEVCVCCPSWQPFARLIY